MMKKNTERINELALKFKNGDQSCFDELYKLTYSKAYYIAFKLTNNKYDAEDIVQESYMVLISKISSLEKIESFISWFNRVVSNKSKDFLKKKTPILLNDGDEREVDVASQCEIDCSLEETVENEERKNKVMNEINKLTTEKRECVVMKYYDELSISQIAENIGIPVSTVKNRLWIARKELMNTFLNNGITAA